MQVFLPTISAENAISIAKAIDIEGFAVVPHYVDSDAIKNTQSFVKEVVAANGGNYLIFKGTGQLSGTFLPSLSADPSFVELCHRIYENITGCVAPDVPLFQVLRCLVGELSRSQILRFHFDSHVLTALIPILIPEQGARGDFLIIPNVRHLRSSYIHNAIDKLLLGNPLSQTILRRLYINRAALIKRIRLAPGHLYLFNGYRSIHTSGECSPDHIRATALLHYVDPHPSSVLRRLLRHWEPGTIPPLGASVEPPISRQMTSSDIENARHATRTSIVP
jgi:hypothetical protein